MRKFDPWIGSQYATQGIRGIRLLILGEAHYGTGEETQGCTHTTEIIRKLGQQGRFRFHTVTQRLVVGGRGWLSNTDRAEFWERVAFYNYVQSFPGPRARWRPTPEMWEAAREPFLETLAEVKPQVLLVLGQELSRKLPVLPTYVSACAVQHPSSRGFRYATWQPAVQAALETRLVDNRSADNDKP
jgi:hypothetical protein